MKEYYGLADCHGIDHFQLLTENVDTGYLVMRATANPQRLATTFKIKLTKKEADKVYDILKKDDGANDAPIEALKYLKSLDKKKLSVLSDAHWKFIPNPKLDKWG